jgi:hypothetical protein
MEYQGLICLRGNCAVFVYGKKADTEDFNAESNHLPIFRKSDER